MLCVILEFGLKNSVACSMHYDILITYMLLIQLSVLCVNGKKILERHLLSHLFRRSRIISYGFILIRNGFLQMFSQINMKLEVELVSKATLTKLFQECWIPHCFF